MATAFTDDKMNHLYHGTRTNMPFYVAVRNSMGDKLDVANAARSSFAKMHHEFDEVGDTRLLEFLGRETHTMPYRHCYLSLHIRVPEFVARQMFRHLVGSEYTFKDTAWSEMSGRYVPYDEWYIPQQFALQHKNKKQGASEEISAKSDEFRTRALQIIAETQKLYDDMIENNVAREQARIVLPVGFYTEFRWTASLQAIAHFIMLRSKPDAQTEIRDVADVIHSLAEERFGDALSILYEHMSNH